MPKRAKQQRVVEALDDAKAVDVRTLDVRRLTDVTDYMIVASGTSTRHVASIARRLVDAMREGGERPLGVEGEDVGEWVLVDFGDVVAHIMHPQTRDFYNLEKLWSQSPLSTKEKAQENVMELRIRRGRARK